MTRHAVAAAMRQENAKVRSDSADCLAGIALESFGGRAFGTIELLDALNRAPEDELPRPLAYYRYSRSARPAVEFGAYLARCDRFRWDRKRANRVWWIVVDRPDPAL